MYGNIGFTRKNRNTTLEDKLHDAKVAFTSYGHINTINDLGDAWSWDELWRLENAVIRLEYLVHCKNYNR